MPSRWDTPVPPQGSNIVLAPPARHRPLRLFENGLIDVSYVEGEDATITLQNSSTTLLRFPGEIRNAIWDLVLGGQFFHIQRSKKFLTKNTVYVPRNYFALSQVCRQAYAETTLLPFNLNSFYLGSNDNIAWVCGLPDAQRHAMAEVYLNTRNATTMTKWSGGLNLPYAFPAAMFSGLQRLHIHVLIDEDGLQFHGVYNITDMVEEAKEHFAAYVKKRRAHVHIEFTD